MKLDKFFFLILLFIAGDNIDFSFCRDKSIFLLIVTIIYIAIRKVRYDKKMNWFLGIWFAYFILSTIVIRSFHPLFMIEIPASILAAYALVVTAKYNLINYYIKVLYVLCIISLFLSAWQYIDTSSLYKLCHPLSLPLNFNYSQATHRAYILIYHISDYQNTLRNCGFTREPGLFACYICLAIYFYWTKSNFKLKSKYTYIFIITLITTISTTGFILLFIILAAFVYSSKQYKVAKNFILVSFIIFASYLFMNLNFLNEKIQEEMNYDTGQMLTYAQKNDTNYTPGRLVSFNLVIKDFLNNPILGLGGNTDNGWLKKSNIGVNTISGLGNFLARFGLFGIVSLLLLIIKASIFITSHYNGVIKYLFVIIMLGIMISYSIQLYALFFMFYLLPFYSKNKIFNLCGLKKHLQC